MPEPVSGTSTLRLLGRGVLLVPLIVTGLAGQALLRRAKPALAYRMTAPFHRLVCRVLGIRRSVSGPLPVPEPMLVLSNHVSWLDIIVLGSLMPLSFVAKSEIDSWPGVNLLARAQRTVFVNRQRRVATGAVAGEIAARLAEGDAIVLFAEGTTSDGNRVLPYRSALIGAAGEGRVCVLPVALQYARQAGLPLTRRERPGIAWYGDMDLVPHLRALLSAPPIDVTIHIGPCLIMQGSADRKRIAAEAEAFARQALADGRLPDAQAELGESGKAP